MTIIADALKKTRQPDFLVVLDFGGLVLRCAKRILTVSYSAGTDFIFDRLLREAPEISATLDIRTLRYSLSEISLAIVNDKRLQDEELKQILDGGIGTIYIWTEGLDWSDIEIDGVIFRGIFYKESHDRNYYDFRLVDELTSKFDVIPESTINLDTWPNHRTEGGAGTVAARVQPLVFGSWTKGIPLLCVDTSAYKYIACIGKAKSTDSEYTATTQNVYDKDGNVISAAGYTFYPSTPDGEGNFVALFDFTSDQSSLEPLSCSIEGLVDTAGDLIEYPADIVLYFIQNKSSLPNATIDFESIKTMQSLRPGMIFSSIINAPDGGLNILDRFLAQCLSARIHRAGKIGLWTFDPDSIPVAHFRDEQILNLPRFSKTPLDQIVTSLRVEYGWNPATGSYENEFVLDHTNNTILKRAYFDYGIYPQKTLSLPDIQKEMVARYSAALYLALFGIRHDLIEIDLTYWDAWDIKEGDSALLTLRDASSIDGEGWYKHPAVLLERHFLADRIRTRWINPKLIEEAMRAITEDIIEEITDEADAIITDEAGEAITTG